MVRPRFRRCWIQICEIGRLAPHPHIVTRLGSTLRELRCREPNERDNILSRNSTAKTPVLGTSAFIVLSAMQSALQFLGHRAQGCTHCRGQHGPPVVGIFDPRRQAQDELILGIMQTCLRGESGWEFLHPVFAARVRVHRECPLGRVPTIGLFSLFGDLDEYDLVKYPAYRLPSCAGSEALALHQLNQRIGCRPRPPKE